MEKKSLENVKKFCCDEDCSLIENYEKAMADTTQVYVCHHKLELISTGAICNVSRQDLIDWGIYYNRPASELIFLTRSEHSALHRTGNPRSEDTKRKISIAFKGRTLSEEHKRKISESEKGKYVSIVTKKKMSVAHTGHHHSDETRRKLSEAAKRRYAKNSPH